MPLSTSLPKPHLPSSFPTFRFILIPIIYILIPCCPCFSFYLPFSSTVMTLNSSLSGVKVLLASSLVPQSFAHLNLPLLMYVPISFSAMYHKNSLPSRICPGNPQQHHTLLIESLLRDLPFCILLVSVASDECPLSSPIVLSAYTPIYSLSISIYTFQQVMFLAFRTFADVIKGMKIAREHLQGPLPSILYQIGRRTHYSYSPIMQLGYP